MIICSVLETQCALKYEVLSFNLHILKSHGICVKEAVLYHDFSCNLIYLRHHKLMISAIRIVQPRDSLVLSHILGRVMNGEHNLSEIDFDLTGQLLLNTVLEFRDLNGVIILCEVYILEYLSPLTVDSSQH